MENNRGRYSPPSYQGIYSRDFDLTRWSSSFELEDFPFSANPSLIAIKDFDHCASIMLPNLKNKVSFLFIYVDHWLLVFLSANCRMLQRKMNLSTVCYFPLFGIKLWKQIPRLGCGYGKIHLTGAERHCVVSSLLRT
ncbi:hypothetical protein RHGRI_038701 [Rhododendron griersonianum]|uniref:Uncharacterized protein n=1 Tax=Rhododendron griersonianum TaxID=479676 RepID=A0AAV6HIG3_9ERIC|nr:hypothetical protein RHGRI_038701 [Rhododendron griersonianum]